MPPHPPRNVLRFLICRRLSQLLFLFLFFVFVCVFVWVFSKHNASGWWKFRECFRSHSSKNVNVLIMVALRLEIRRFSSHTSPKISVRIMVALRLEIGRRNWIGRPNVKGGSKQKYIEIWHAKTMPPHPPKNVLTFLIYRHLSQLFSFFFVLVCVLCECLVSIRPAGGKNLGSIFRSHVSKNFNVFIMVALRLKIGRFPSHINPQISKYLLWSPSDSKLGAEIELGAQMSRGGSKQKYIEIWHAKTMPPHPPRNVLTFLIYRHLSQLFFFFVLILRFVRVVSKHKASG